MWLAVAGTSALGAVGRLAVTAGFERSLNRNVPWGTAAVNLVAAFLLGLFMGGGPSEDSIRLLGAGFLGSFSTYSTWMVEGVFLAGSGSRSALTESGLWVVGLLALGFLAYGGGWNLSR